MSRSKGDRPGGRVNGEIMGRGTSKVVDDRIVTVCGGEEVGSPIRKREAKASVRRQRRAGDRTVVRSGVREAAEERETVGGA